MRELGKTFVTLVRVLEDEVTKELDTIWKTNACKIQEIVTERRCYEIEQQELE